MNDNTQLVARDFFPTSIYTVDGLEFLKIASQVSDEYLDLEHKTNSIDEIYPVIMSKNFFDDVRIEGLSSFIGETAWGILNEQGYNVKNMSTFFLEMWAQEHFKHSSMEQHVHGNNSQIVGFYFLETPENCSQVVFHDPRSSKVQIDLSEQSRDNITSASKVISFNPSPGTLIFTNSWLAHSFTRHASNEPFKFIHFSLGVKTKSDDLNWPAWEAAAAEVI